MSLEHTNEHCAYCKAILFEPDDVVYCPECGAPHHRECYQKLGHCALKELHGTENEYSRIKSSEEIKPDFTETQPKETFHECEYCHEKYSSDIAKCPKCGQPNMEKIMFSAGFDMLGGVAKDAKLAENVTADDARKFVMANTQRYIPKFALMSMGKKASWNWFAFLFPSGWFLSRKMYSVGAFVTLINVISSFFTMPLFYSLTELMPTESATNFQEQMEVFAKVLPKVSLSLLIFAAVGFALNLVLRIISGIFGDLIYRNHTVKKIGIIKKDFLNESDLYRKYGGVNILLFLLSLMIIEYLPNLLYSFIA